MHCRVVRVVVQIPLLNIRHSRRHRFGAQSRLLLQGSLVGRELIDIGLCIRCNKRLEEFVINGKILLCLESDMS